MALEAPTSGTSPRPPLVLMGADTMDRCGFAIRDQLPETRDAIILSGPTPARIHKSRVVTSLKAAGFRTRLRVLPPGEGTKDFKLVSRICAELAEAEVDRSALVVGLGGGVVIDFAGFVASSYLGGMPLLQIPTTLVAQVDAAVGGKCAISMAPGKNNVGTIYPASQVVIDTGCLTTLSRGQIASGAAEVVKFAALFDEAFLGWLEARASTLLEGHLADLAHAVERSVALKSQAMVEDPAGVREQEYLCFGHRLAGVIETLSAPHGPAHGEALAVGMSFATHLGELSGTTDPALGARVRGILRSFGLPTTLPPLDHEVLRQAMKHDSEGVNGRRRFVLLERIGKPVLRDDLPDELIAEALRWTRAFAAGSHPSMVAGTS